MPGCGIAQTSEADALIWNPAQQPEQPGLLQPTVCAKHSPQEKRTGRISQTKIWLCLESLELAKAQWPVSAFRQVFFHLLCLVHCFISLSHKPEVSDAFSSEVCGRERSLPDAFSHSTGAPCMGWESESERRRKRGIKQDKWGESDKLVRLKRERTWDVLWGPKEQ